MNAQDLVDKTIRTFKGVTEDQALEYLQEVHTHILSNVRLNIETITINLTSGTGEYAIDDDILRVWTARYLVSATSQDVLNPTHVDELNKNHRDWKVDSASTPNLYYVEGSNLGLYPVPDTTTSGGYPVVKCEVTRDQTLSISGTPTVIPEFARRPQAWIMGACKAIALDKEDSRIDRFTVEFERELRLLSESITGRNVNFHPSIRSKSFRTRVGKV